MTKERISRNNGVREKVDLTELLAGVEVRVVGMVRALTFESTHAWDRLWNRQPFFGEVFFTCTAGFFVTKSFFSSLQCHLIPIISSQSFLLGLVISSFLKPEHHITTCVSYHRETDRQLVAIGLLVIMSVIVIIVIIISAGNRTEWDTIIQGVIG